jgi:hypothetical protein
MVACSLTFAQETVMTAMTPYKRLISLAQAALSLVVLSACAISERSNNNMFPRTNGVYQCSEEDSDGTGPYSNYLRFYRDGHVIEVSSTGTPAEIWRWFSRERKDLSHGTLALSGDRVSFQTVSPEGMVDYSGHLNGTSLMLDSVSHINGHKGHRTYHFAKLPADGNL